MKCFFLPYTLIKYERVPASQCLTRRVEWSRGGAAQGIHSVLWQNALRILPQNTMDAVSAQVQASAAAEKQTHDGSIF